jgi:hypothetical protein
MTKHCI